MRAVMRVFWRSYGFLGEERALFDIKADGERRVEEAHWVDRDKHLAKVNYRKAIRSYYSGNLLLCNLFALAAPARRKPRPLFH